MLANSLDYVQRPEFVDVKKALRDGHMLAVFGKGLRSAIRANRDHHYSLTPSFMARLILRSLRTCIRHPVPGPVKQCFRRRYSWLPGSSSAIKP